MDRRLRPSGITTQQAALLTVAGSREEGLRLGELAAALGVTHQNVRQLVDSLARKGFVEVRADPDDRRARRVVPTHAVRDVFAGRDREDFLAVEEWLSAIDDEEAATLERLLDRLAASLAHGA